MASARPHFRASVDLCIAHDRQADPVPLSQHKIHERPLTTLLGHSASLSERLFLPLTGHPARRRGMPESGGYLPLGLWVSTVPYPIPERTFDDVSTSRSATAGTRQQRASRRPRLPNQSFSDLLSGAEKPGGISAFLQSLANTSPAAWLTRPRSRVRARRWAALAATASLDTCSRSQEAEAQTLPQLRTAPADVGLACSDGCSPKRHLRLIARYAES